jgi:DNA-binding YbaB/EbfC family protein
MGLLDGLGSLGQLGGLMQKVQDMQARIKELHEEMDARRFEGQAGGGVVTATVTGRGDVVGVKLNGGSIDPSDTAMLEELIVSAVSSAAGQAREAMKEEMQKVTGGLNLPGLNEMFGLGG